MAADGSIVIEANLKVSQAEKSLKKLEDEIKNAEETIEKGSNEGFSEQIDRAKEKAGELRKVMVGVEKTEFSPGYSKEAMEYIDNYSKNLSNASNEMKRALENAALKIKDLEKQGKWFGDEDYDTAVKQFERIAGDIAEYKKSLLSPEKPENPFGIDTISGKVREAEIALERLKFAGKGLGDTEYDKAYRSLSLLKDEARQYAAELSKTPTQAEREASVLAKAAKKAEEAVAKERQAEAEAARLQAIKENAVISNQAVVRLNQELQVLKMRLNDLKNAGIGSGYEEYDRISARMQEINSELKGIQSRTTSISTSSSKMGIAMERAKKSMSGFATRLKGVVTSALVFTVVFQALAKFRDWMGKVIQTNSEASAAVARLRGSLLTLAQPLVNILIPAFTTLVNVLTRIVSVVSRVVSSLFGTTAEQSAQAAENIYNETNAIEGVAGAAKKASKSLAAFDEINQLSDNSAGESSGGGVSGGGTAPDFSGPINDSLTGIVELFTGAALLALGAILTFSGAHILLGLGLMVLGALAIWDAVSTNWTEIQTMLQGPLGALVAVISGALLVIGIILCFSTGPSPLSIGLIAAGAIGLAAEVALNWGAIVEALQGPLGILVGIISGALIVLGVILCITGVGIPLGIALILAGAIGLVTSVAINWNAIVDKVKEIWNSIKNFWNTHIAKFFTAEWWANLGKDMLNGLIGGVESGINFVLRGVGSLVNGVISLINKIPGVNIGYVDWGHVQIPRLAQGAVIPPNREFMAVLGDQRNGRNLEAPEDLIRKIVREESGGSEVVALLQAILDATKAGRKMYVDKKVLAETAKDGINDMTIAAGRPVLLY